MPRKDPITGCMVMTIGEFWQAEGERKGTSAAEEAESFFTEMADEEAKENARLREPFVAVDILRSAIEQWNKDAEPEDAVTQVYLVREVLDAESSWSFRTTKTHIRARALDSEGREGVINYWESSYSGSFYEPPDGDMEIAWEYGPWKEAI